jgi:RND family efflux transporter MFP subunit
LHVQLKNRIYRPGCSPVRPFHSTEQELQVFRPNQFHRLAADTRAETLCVNRALTAAAGALLVLLVAGCSKPAPAAPAAPPAMPVATQPVALGDVPQRDSYVATIKSRRTTTLQPQVDGRITRILVHSGQVVKAGQLLMQIDPLKQQAAVQQGLATEFQQKAQLQYNQTDLQRQKALFEAGVISKQAYDQSTQGFGTSTGAYNAAVASTATQREVLSYYQIRAPFSGIVGDVPVHQGDYVSPTTVLTTVDEDKDLEAYIYVPTERSSIVHNGLPVELLDTAGKTLTKTSLNFVSPQVDNGTQSILAKAPVSAAENLRNQQIVSARITWDTKPGATVPILAVTRIGGAAFVYLASAQGQGFAAHLTPVTLGDPVGNSYPVVSGLKPGDRVIVSGLQMLQEGAPVRPL